jgi:homoserine O-acetyltransferase
MTCFTRSALAWAVLTCAAPLHGQDLRTADLGTCALESGEELRPCTVAYRTLGSLNAARDNAVLVPTWFTGTSEQMLDLVATLADTARFHVIVVDAFGNGVSTSPSNSPTQGGEAFPRITIGDMVASQYRLVTEELGLERLYAVTGASMGGMQTFEWMVAHPGFFEKAVPLIGSPRLGAYDVALWETELRILDLYEACRCADAAATLAGVGMLTSSSPDAFNARSDRTAIGASLESGAEATLSRPDGWTYDMASQLHAMIAHDVARNFGGDLTRAAGAVTADLLSVVVRSDHVVTPGPAVEFAGLAGGESIVLDNAGGHGGLFLPGTNWTDRVQAFLAR